ncbi:MAG TPA: very short patch repair endonuclease [Shinella sp.]|jgi:DNA mismatch endonuclease (patch repair protein)|uniref:very short patch repair endonuclease n=1 Tax=Shinella sp. TaxID=1870904 RepID=UPI002E110ACC|nr:very short patch repair endonuclease [Shinella sp.]
MDKITPSRRSANMRAIRSKDTKPELIVRKTLRAVGLSGYRLHRKDLPGRPDITFIGRKKAIFVHGCFWHGHDCREGNRRPKSRQGYWLPKISGNQARDARHQQELASRGWDVLIVWDCETRSSDLVSKLISFMNSRLGHETHSSSEN